MACANSARASSSRSITPITIATAKAELQTFINRCLRRDLAMVVTTEKDAVRFPRLMTPEVPIFFLRVEIEILSGHESWEHCVARICQPQPMLSPERFLLLRSALRRITRTSSARKRMEKEWPTKQN